MTTLSAVGTQAVDLYCFAFVLPRTGNFCNFKEPPMPKNKVSDPITDQEIAFARMVLSGGMTDRQAAEAVGLNPDSAAYIKAKPRVREYMVEHRAAVEQQLVQQEAEGLRRQSLHREQVLDRLWEIAHLSPEITRGSITGQVKALSMIVAILNLIPDRRATSAQNKFASAPVSQIYPVAGHAEQSATQAAEKRAEAPSEALNVAGHELAPSPGAEAPAEPGPSQSEFANRVTSSEEPPYIPSFASVPHTRVPFIHKEEQLCPPPLSCQS
jgi:hypothetical protein